jgi:uncharacterized delta-60 repeat protein
MGRLTPPSAAPEKYARISAIITLIKPAPPPSSRMARLWRPDLPSPTTAGSRTSLARYGSNGVLNTTFSSDGMTQIDFGSCCQSAYSVLLQGDGKIITVGYPNTESSDSDFLLARLNADGALDPTFGIGGKVRASFGDLNDAANGALLQPDGKIVAVGFHTTPSNRFSEFEVARFLGSSSTFSLTSAVSRKTHAARGLSTSLCLWSESRGWKTGVPAAVTLWY